MQRKSIVLLSGGLDSALSIVLAKQESHVLYGLTYDYGQNSVKKEIKASLAICAHLMIEHKVVKLPFFDELRNHPLLGNAKPPTVTIEELDDKEKTKDTAKAVWVPNRNGIFLNIAAGLAEMNKVDYLYAGFNKEEASTFPDNTEDFLKAMNQSLSFSTWQNVFVKAPTIGMTKPEIVKKLVEEKFPLELVWSCYKDDGDKMCGECESCMRLKRALMENDMEELVEAVFT
ncbi:MAG: 7-cyano-7-deazaguanine synthase QueC [bacterium]|nr:7-cyano-7-deazaguanine synthase QueC [bacterium]MBU1919091.1 7-cyano-7-deazaguanine synthase QueC [bacterium]